SPPPIRSSRPRAPRARAGAPSRRGARAALLRAAVARARPPPFVSAASSSVPPRFGVLGDFGEPLAEDLARAAQARRDGAGRNRLELGDARRRHLLDLGKNE